MYFYNVFFIIFPFPKSKIYLCILPLCLTPASGGGEGFEVLLSLAGHPDSVTPPNPTHLHPAVLVGGGREAPPSWVPISCLLFHEATQLGGLARLFLCSILIPPLTEISDRQPRILLQQILQPFTSLISLMSGLRCESTRMSRVSLWTLSLLPERTELKRRFCLDPTENLMTRQCRSDLQRVLLSGLFYSKQNHHLQHEHHAVWWNTLILYTHRFLLIFTSSVDAMKRPRVLWPKQRFMLFFHQIRRPGSARFDPVHQPSAAGSYFSITTGTRVGLYLMTCFSGVRRATVLQILIR